MNITVYPVSKTEPHAKSVRFTDVEDVWFVNAESFGDLQKVSADIYDNGGLLINPANVVAIKVED